MLSIIIPSRTEKYLNNTILDVLEKAKGQIEVLPVLDGYKLPENEIIKDPRVKYIYLESSASMQKRQGINEAVRQSKYEHIMSLDAHCMMGEGFDEILERDCRDNWVMIPRRLRLDAEHWCLEPSYGRPPIDYEYIMFRPLLKFGQGLHGYKWNSRTVERMDIPIDDIITMQASCWFMHKDWFNKMGFMQIEGYTGWGQEAEEISFTTWKNGGEVKVNKNTWYAHLHKGNKYGRMYKMNFKENRRCYDYSYNLWINENKDFFIKLMEKFMPIQGWSPDWKEKLYDKN